MKKLFVIFTFSTLITNSTISADDLRKIEKIEGRKSEILFNLPLDAAENFISGRSNEQKHHEQLVELFAGHFRNRYSTPEKRAKQSDQGQKGLALRAVHAKGHSCLRGSFTILDHPHDHLKSSVFAKPKRYDAFIRVSNGDGPPMPDGDKKLSLGLAVKLRNVEGKFFKHLGERSVDFLMTNHPEFVVSDIVGYAAMIKLREAEGFLSLGKSAFAIAREHGLGSVKLGLQIKKGIKERNKHELDRNPLTIPYWSNLPFRLGDELVKYLAIPVSCDSGRTLKAERIAEENRSDASPNYLSDHLKKRVKDSDFCYDFHIQTRATPRIKVEDARAKWPEKGHSRKLAQLIIPKQMPNELLGREGSPGLQTCQNLAFSPWNSTTDFRPLGSLNRARKVVYELSAEMRHALNMAPNPEAQKP